VSITVLIAASNHLAALQQHPDLTDADAFADTDALKALDAITRRRPQVVALEQSFAASARGAAFVNRIKADPALAACEIRILQATSGVTTGTSPAAETSPEAVAIAPPPAATLDRSGTRRAERHVVSRNVEVLIDGNPATLVNISIVGAQVVSMSSLRPNQRVRMSLVDATRPMRFNGVIAWANFEMPKEGPRYRAGVNFYDASPDMVARFIESVTAT
jgi:PilZ domain-containing protein